MEVKKPLAERIFRNWKTSVIGLTILIGSLAMVYFEKASLGEAGVFLGIGFGLFFLKDK